MSALKLRLCLVFILLRSEARDFTPYSLVRILGSSSPVTVPRSLRLTITRYFHFQTPATNTLKSFGGFAILNFGLDADPKECGCQRLRLILKCSTYLPASTSGSPYCRLIRRNPRANCDAAPGVMQAAAVSILPCRIA